MVEQLDRPAEQTAAEAPTEVEEAPDAESWIPPTGTTAEARFRDWMAQLQAMIDGVTTAAAPHVREIAAKAAELAAKAGEAAGPIAKRAATATSDVGQKVAAKSRDFAADMRRMAEHEAPAAGEEAAATFDAAGEAATTESPEA
jgi:hypothetical protein